MASLLDRALCTIQNVFSPQVAHCTAAAPAPAATPAPGGAAATAASASASESVAAAALPPPAPKPRRKKRIARSLPQPGAYSDLSAEANAALAVNTFQGLKLHFTRSIQKENKNFSPMVMLWLGGGEQAGSDSFTQLQLPLQVGNANIMGVHFPTHQEGSLSWGITPAIQSFFNFRVSPADPSKNALSGTLNYKGRGYSAGVSYAEQQCAASYLQSITPTVALGLQAFYIVPACKTIVELAARHKRVNRAANKGETFALRCQMEDIDRLDFDATYSKRFNEYMTLATCFKYNTTQRHSLFQVGGLFQYNMFRFSTSVDGDGTLKSMYESALGMENVMFGISGELNYFTDQSRWGIMVSVGG